MTATKLLAEFLGEAKLLFFSSFSAITVIHDLRRVSAVKLLFVTNPLFLLQWKHNVILITKMFKKK